MTEEQIFLAALDLPDQAARTAYLDEVCGQDSKLRRQVEELLAAHLRTGKFLDEPVAEQMAEHHIPSGPTIAIDIEGGEAMADPKKTNSSPSDDANEDFKFLSPSKRPDSLGRLGHYEMLQVLGRGGFGIVFRAFDDILQRVVAVKVMAPQIATLSPARKRFVREAQSSAAIRHENVVHVYEIGEQPLPYLVMEFIPGESLQQKLDRSGPLDVPEVLRIGRQIAEGLAAAHASDLIHRDIKPGNVLLEGGSQKVKITDFGLARAADDASISQSGVVAGTPMFMSPEQALGHQIDQRADLFSLGSVLYQMTSGRPPFRAPSALAVLKRVAEEQPRPIPEIIPETPDWMCRIIAKLHAKNPDERFQSAREVADLLADCEAKLKSKQEVKNVLPAAKPVAPKRSSGRIWVAAAAILLLPVLALAVTEFAGVTHLFRGQQVTADPDRKAAEYVLSIGGQVQVDDRNRKINAVAELPRDPFRLTWVGLMHNNQVSETGLASFKDCKNLTFLGLFDTSVSDEGLANFQNCKNLAFLNLSRTKIGDAGLANFKDCTELTIVVLSETKVSDTGLAYLKNSKKLANLFLQKTKVTAAGVDELRKELPLCKIEWDSGASEPPPLVAWGKFEDPDKDCAFTEENGELVITVPGKEHDLSIERSKMNSPCAMQPVDGDFIVQVKVAGQFDPGQMSAAAGRKPYQGAGIFLRTDDNNYITLDRGAMWDGKTHVAYANFELRISGRLERMGKPSDFRIENGKDTWLKIERTGNNFAAYATQEAGKWQPLGAKTMDAPRQIHLGVAAKNTSLKPFTPRFSGFRLKAEGLTPVPPSNAPTVHDAWLKAIALLPADQQGAVVAAKMKEKLAGFDGALLNALPGMSGAAQLTLVEAWLKERNPAFAGFDDAWLKAIPAMSAEAQVMLVTAWLKERNPAFAGEVTHKIEGGVLTGLDVSSPLLQDLTPLRTVTGLKTLMCRSTVGYDYKADNDAAVLRSLKKLENINGKSVAQFWKDVEARQAEFKDWLKLVPTLTAKQQVDAVAAKLKERNPGFDGDVQHLVEDDKVTELRFKGENVTDLSPVQALMGLKVLDCNGGPLSDLSPLKGMAGLAALNVSATQVQNLSPLKSMPLTSLNLSGTPVLDLEPIKGMPLATLHLSYTKVRDLAPLKGMSLTTLAAHDCFEIRDLTPLVGMPLTNLHLWQCPVADLAPLKGLPLTKFYFCGNRSQVHDLSPLKDMPLTELVIIECAQVKDLDPLKGMKLTDLNLYACPEVRDLTPLKGMPLKTLAIASTGVTDLKPLQDMELKEIRLTPKNITQGLQVLRDMKSLETIGIHSEIWPAAGFWERFDKGEFKQ